MKCWWNESIVQKISNIYKPHITSGPKILVWGYVYEPYINHICLLFTDCSYKGQGLNHFYKNTVKPPYDRSPIKRSSPCDGK